MDVVVRFTEGQAPYIRERIWHPSQDLEELEDGRVVLRLRAGGFYEIKSWALSFGAAAEVREPEELRAKRCGRRCGRRWGWMTRVRRDLSQECHIFLHLFHRRSSRDMKFLGLRDLESPSRADLEESETVKT